MARSGYATPFGAVVILRAPRSESEGYPALRAADSQTGLRAARLPPILTEPRHDRPPRIPSRAAPGLRRNRPRADASRRARRRTRLFRRHLRPHSLRRRAHQQPDRNRLSQRPAYRARHAAHQLADGRHAPRRPALGIVGRLSRAAAAHSSAPSSSIRSPTSRTPTSTT